MDLIFEFLSSDLFIFIQTLWFNVNIKQRWGSSDFDTVELKNYTQVENSPKEMKMEIVFASFRYQIVQERVVCRFTTTTAANPPDTAVGGTFDSGEVGYNSETIRRQTLHRCHNQS